MSQNKIATVGFNRSLKSQLTEVVSLYFSETIHIINLDKLSNDIEYGLYDCLLIFTFNDAVEDFICKINKEKKFFIPIIVIEKNFNDANAIKSLRLGVSDYLTVSDLTTTQFQLGIQHAIEKKKNSLAQMFKEQKMYHIAYHDYLTGLSNRAYFDQVLRRSVARSKRRKISLAVCMLDLDGFKSVNDTFGHAYGDLLLKKIAKIFQRSIRQSDILSRFGGDEFALILYDVVSVEEASGIAKKIITKFLKPIKLRSHLAHVSTSIGIAFYDETVPAPHALIERADKALYIAKKSGKNTYKFYTDEFNERVRVREIIKNNIENQIKKNSYQLKVNKYCQYLSESSVYIMQPSLGKDLPYEKYLPLYRDLDDYFSHAQGTISSIKNYNKDGKILHLLELDNKLCLNNEVIESLLVSQVDGVLMDVRQFSSTLTKLAGQLKKLKGKKILYIKNYIEEYFDLKIFELFSIDGVIVHLPSFHIQYKNGMDKILKIVEQVVNIYNIKLLLSGGDDLEIFDDKAGLLLNMNPYILQAN